MSPALADPLALDVDGLGMYGLDARTLDLLGTNREGGESAGSTGGI